MAEPRCTLVVALLLFACTSGGGGDPGGSTGMGDSNPGAEGSPSASDPSAASASTAASGAASDSTAASGADDTQGDGPGTCGVTPDRIRIREVDVGVQVLADEDEVALHPITISPIPSGGARLAWVGEDGQIHVTALDADDTVVGPAFALPGQDLAALHADDDGGVVLLTRPAEGGGTLNCGAPTNLCGTPPDPAVPCFDMVLARFDGETETWATRLTDADAELPPYSTGPDGPNVTFIWWYAHHGRIAFDGARWAAYFGAAISVSQEGCINIHQGDRMQVVDAAGNLADGGFDWGCSHSGYERIAWDGDAGAFVTVCKTDNDNRIAFAPDYRTIRPVDLWYANLGELVPATGGGTWMITSDIRDGQPSAAEGLADVHLLHAFDGEPDIELVIPVDASLNARAPHLAAYGDDRMIAAWETSTSPGDLVQGDPARQMFVQTRDRTTGVAEGDAIEFDVLGNRYHELVAFPDGSVAFTAPGSTATSITIARVLPCGG